MGDSGAFIIYLTQVNNSINLSSSTEKLNMSSNSTPPSPSLLSSPSNMFRPIKNSPSWEYQPSPEKDGYGLRPRNSTGKQCTRPSSRKRSSRLSGESMAIDKPIKRLRLESHPTPNTTPSSDERTISSDSGIFINKSSTSTTEPTCTTHPVSSANSSDVEFHWWHKTHRTRRLSTESIVSTDSITREINKPL